MQIPPGATSYTPPPSTLTSDIFSGTSHRHTFRPHGCEDWLFIYTLGGLGCFDHKDGRLQVAAHEITLYRPGAFQHYRRDPGASSWDFIYAHFLPRPEWLDWLEWPEVSPGLFHLILPDKTLRLRVVKRLRDMVRLSRGSEHRHEAFGLNALEEVFLWCDSINPRRAHLRLDPRVRRVMDDLIEHCAEPFSPDRLARLSGLSESRLRHMFREQTGLAPREFQEQQRLRQARELLRLSSLTIAEISRTLGFDNPFYFSLRFKKHTGENPRAFRQRELAAPRRHIAGR